VKCSDYFGAKRRGLLKVKIVLVPKGAIQNFIKNIRYDKINKNASQSSSEFCSGNPMGGVQLPWGKDDLLMTGSVKVRLVYHHV
jgi:hypothetical protein